MSNVHETTVTVTTREDLERRSEESRCDSEGSTADEAGGALQQAPTWRAHLVPRLVQAAPGTLHSESAELRARIDAAGSETRPWLGVAPRIPLARVAAGAALARAAGLATATLLRGHAAPQVRIEAERLPRVCGLGT